MSHPLNEWHQDNAMAGISGRGNGKMFHTKVEYQTQLFQPHVNLSSWDSKLLNKSNKLVLGSFYAMNIIFVNLLIINKFVI